MFDELPLFGQVVVFDGPLLALRFRGLPSSEPGLACLDPFLAEVGHFTPVPSRGQPEEPIPHQKAGRDEKRHDRQPRPKPPPFANWSHQPPFSNSSLPPIVGY